MFRSANRVAAFLAGSLALCALAPAATLEKLELDEMIRKSSEIVRGKVLAKSAGRRGSIIYTEATVAVTERLKGATNATVKVATPGGSMNGVTQTFPGSPDLQVSSEYVFFLWTGKSGVTQIVGLSQGLLDLAGAGSAGNGSAKLRRAAIDGGLVDPASGKVVSDQPVSLTLDVLRQRVKRVLGDARE